MGDLIGPNPTSVGGPKYKDFKGFKEGFKGFNKVFRFSDFDFQVQRHQICLGGNFQLLIS